MSISSSIALGIALCNSANDSWDAGEDSGGCGTNMRVKSDAEKETEVYLKELATEHVVNAKQLIADTHLTAQEKVNLLEKELNLSILSGYDRFVYFGGNLINHLEYYSNKYPDIRTDMFYAETKRIQACVHQLVNVFRSGNRKINKLTATGERGYNALRKSIARTESKNFTSLNNKPNDPIYKLLGLGQDFAAAFVPKEYTKLGALMITMGLADLLGYYTPEVYRYCFSYYKLNVLSLDKQDVILNSCEIGISSVFKNI